MDRAWAWDTATEPDPGAVRLESPPDASAEAYRGCSGLFLFLGFLYDLSEEEVVARVETHLAFLWFLGLFPEDHLPDPSLLSRFRRDRLGMVAAENPGLAAELATMVSMPRPLRQQCTQNQSTGRKVRIRDCHEIAVQAPKQGATDQYRDAMTKPTCTIYVTIQALLTAIA
jgi:hypothetical protein